ncbi:MAG: pqq-dependent dehydrogenase, methanol/ethanol family [Labilithrix sp.]|nr:pqq-dependent dehydrogenase, methanol/ethanol family [Labilithrix sp.]
MTSLLRQVGRLAATGTLLLLAGSPGCRKQVTPEVTAQGGPLSGATAVTLTPASSQPAEDGQWTMVGKDAANTRYSRLSTITEDNAKDLRLVWSQKTGVERGHEAAPLVVGHTMAIVTPYPNKLIAWDLERPGSPPKWTYEPPTLPAAQGVACCDVVNRGAAYDKGRFFFNTLDVQTVAVDAETGREIWRTKLGDISRGETITMAPLVVKGKVIVGNSGGEMGVRGWLAAVDAETGALAWRAYATGPDQDVLIGPDFTPHYDSDKGHDLGVTSWPVDQWKIGGGTAWGFVSYDAELDLLYYGTSNPGPWNHEARPGDNKWTAGIFARRPDTGQAKWYYQLNPHDLFDHDGVNENVLLDMTVDGRLRKVLAHTDRNGYVYIIDRGTGEVLSATPYVYITSSTGVDLKTGRLQPVKALEPKSGKVTRDICPSSNGGKDWQPMSFSPRTGLLYIPHQNECMDEEGTEANYIAGTPYVGANVKFKPGPGGHRGELTAWDPVHGKAVWKRKEKFPVWSGTVVTAGDVVFFGTMDGWFYCVSAKTGAELWKFKTDSGIVGQPITFSGPDGKQYVAVLDGVGGWTGAIVSGDLGAQDQSAALGMGGLMGDLKKATKKGGAIYVFGLP